MSAAPAPSKLMPSAEPDAIWWGGALVAGVIGAGFLLASDRIPDHPLAATASVPISG
jgi:hypothetical protein